jgi:hypothetical protein
VVLELNLCLQKVDREREYQSLNKILSNTIKWYESRNKLCQRNEISRIMRPRRHRERPVVNATMEEEMRQLLERMDAMETTQMRAPKDGDSSEDESEDIE